MWTVNDFNLTIKRKHFDTLRERYQIPVDIPIYLPFKFEKCYYRGADDVWVYEKIFKEGFRLPLSALLLGVIFLGAEVLYGVLSKGRRQLTVEEFFHYYRPFEIVKSRGFYNFLLRKTVHRLVYETPDSNQNWKNWYFFIQGDN